MGTRKTSVELYPMLIFFLVLIFSFIITEPVSALVFLKKEKSPWEKKSFNLCIGYPDKVAGNSLSVYFGNFDFYGGGYLNNYFPWQVDQLNNLIENEFSEDAVGAKFILQSSCTEKTDIYLVAIGGKDFYGRADHSVKGLDATKEKFGLIFINTEIDFNFSVTGQKVDRDAHFKIVVAHELLHLLNASHESSHYNFRFDPRCEDINYFSFEAIAKLTEIPLEKAKENFNTIFYSFSTYDASSIMNDCYTYSGKYWRSKQEILSPKDRLGIKEYFSHLR